MLESSLTPLTLFRIPLIFLVHMALILNASFCVSVNLHLDSKALATHSHSEVSVSILGDIEMRCEFCSARAEERGGEVLLVGCLYVLNMVQVILPPSICFSFPPSIGSMIFSVIYQENGACIDALQTSGCFPGRLQVPSHPFPCFSARTCEGI